ncbi:hypothetical protein [Proteus terrae]|uniref:hypothetical protein n=1 Tax=Proteus terrae TaxID=1574161 RepID=UPI001BA883FC|nr:hypothetical protein [Proteus terrae]
MTAEIAVYNKTAVALAADSAVTISGGSIYKINNGAEKLFSLSKHQPVGIMVYGVGSLCGVPWEIIIKAYRIKLGARHFDQVNDYAEDFWSFLCDSNEIISNEMRISHLEVSFHNVFLSLIEYVKSDRILPALKRNESVSEMDTCVFVQESCEKCIENFESCEFFQSFDENTLKEAFDFAIPYAEELFNTHLNGDGCEEFREKITNLLAQVFSLSVCKMSPFGSNSGVVIAGYGDKEYFPNILAFDVYGFFNEKVMLHFNKGKSTCNGDSGVTAYAQEDEVNAFMQGVSSDLASYIKGNIEAIPDSASQHLKDAVLNKFSLRDDENDVLLGEIRQVLDAHSKACIHNIEKVVTENYISKVVEMIEFLPKPDLGYMAESLVNLTAFKRKVSNDSETVGGPIDVAIISKGDGFVWIKRKHYFDENLNHDYFSRR